MYDFNDKQTLGVENHHYDDLYFDNSKYLPFSLLINLKTYYYNPYSINKLLTEYKRSKNKVEEMSKVVDGLKGWIDDVPFKISTFKRNGYSRNLISKLHEYITTETFFREVSFRGSDHYVKGYYTLFHFNNNEYKIGKCYFVLMVKREYVKYVKLCILLNEPILEDCFELWYDESLCSEKPTIKKLCNKIIKELKLIDVPCINKSDILNLLQTKIEFKAPTISKQKELINKFVDEFQEYEKNKK